MKTSPINDQEINQFRSETKGTFQKIHFNNAGCSFPTDGVVETVKRYLEEEAIMGGYETESKYRDSLENIYSLVADFIHAEKEEIALVENASAAWGIAFHGISWNKGDEIIVSEMEYATNLLGYLSAREKYGIEFKLISQDDEGNFPLDALEKAINSNTRLISITHIGSGAGGILPIEKIGEIARRHHILYLVDACQTIGHIPINVKKIGCDMLSVTGRKYLRAPRGTGFLYIRKEIQDKIRPFFMDGHSTQWIHLNEYKLRDDARRFELYEKNRALILGMGKAIEYASSIGMDRIWERIQSLAEIFRRKLQALLFVEVQDKGNEKCGIVTFTVSGMDSLRVKNYLADKSINVSVGNPQSTLFYMNKKNLEGVVRASIHYYNTIAEIDTFCLALEEMVRLPLKG
jgi:selenocysteine lyase/cysteine desulfurase